MEQNGTDYVFQIDTGAGLVAPTYGISSAINRSLDAINVDNKSTNDPRRIPGKKSVTVDFELYPDNPDAVYTYLLAAWNARTLVDWGNLGTISGVLQTGQGYITSLNDDYSDAAGFPVSGSIEVHGPITVT